MTANSICRRSTLARPLLARLGAVLLVLGAAGSAHAAPPPSWDRVANIKAVAQTIGDIQKRSGADAAYKFISACYKTHGLASAFSKAFEGCIAQDYIQSRALAIVYGRLPPEHLERIGAPSAEQLVTALQKRLGSAFRQYKVPTTEGEAFLRLVDQHGMPVFMATVFPGDKR